MISKWPEVGHSLCHQPTPCDRAMTLDGLMGWERGPACRCSTVQVIGQLLKKGPWGKDLGMGVPYCQRGFTYVNPEQRDVCFPLGWVHGVDFPLS